MVQILQRHQGNTVCSSQLISFFLFIWGFLENSRQFDLPYQISGRTLQPPDSRSERQRSLWSHTERLFVWFQSMSSALLHSPQQEQTQLSMWFKRNSCTFFCCHLHHHHHIEPQYPFWNTSHFFQLINKQALGWLTGALADVHVWTEQDHWVFEFLGRRVTGERIKIAQTWE